MMYTTIALVLTAFSAVHSINECRTYPSDLVLVLDLSGNTPDGDWQSIQDFLLHLLSKAYSDDEGHQRVALVTFSESAEVKSALNSPMDDVVTVIQSLQPVASKDRNLTSALSSILQEVFVGAHGERPSYPNIAIVVTTGMPTSDTESTLSSALLLHQARTAVFAVGIGANFSGSLLEGIVSEPASTYLYSLDDVDQLMNISEGLTKDICHIHSVAVPGWQGPPGSTGQSGFVGPSSDVKGKIGFPGATGQTGPQGEAGRKGERGLRGQLGETGTVHGATGPPGPPGKTGSTGPVGPKGVKGDLGDPGRSVMGKAGAVGATGHTGIRGPVGGTGGTGNTGPEGAPGHRAQQGATGPTGITGATGPPGPKGAKGDAGDVGARGGTGRPGPVGILQQVPDHCSAEPSPCDQICINLIHGYMCDCYPGYQLIANTSTCKDVDECENHNGHCEQFCHNKPGSYSCSCGDGFTLSKDTRTCLDVDECCEDCVYKDVCGDHQTCVNTYGRYYCVDSWRLVQPAPVNVPEKGGSQKSQKLDFLLSREMFIGILTWLGGVTILLLLDLILALMEDTTVTTSLRDLYDQYHPQVVHHHRTSGTYSPSEAAKYDQTHRPSSILDRYRRSTGEDHFIFPRLNIWASRRWPTRSPQSVSPTDPEPEPGTSTEPSPIAVMEPLPDMSIVEAKGSGDELIVLHGSTPVDSRADMEEAKTYF